MGSQDKVFTFSFLTSALRASTIETFTFEVLNGSHMNTSFFLIIIPNRYSTTPMEIFYQKVQMSPTNNYLLIKKQQKQLKEGLFY